MTETLPIGGRLGPYRLTGMVGRGGMGIVYRAERSDDGSEVALKVLSSELKQSSEFRRRFLREARYAGAVSHPNVVSVLDSGDADGLLYIAMQFVAGSDLGTILAQEQALEPVRAVSLLTQTAAAVDAVHAAGLLHRDVKPGNIIVESTEAGERAYLTDFGLGKDPGGDSVALTAAGFFVGSSPYSAPEQIMATAIDRRADVYSLGCVLFECLTGSPPFLRDIESDVLRAHVQDEPPKVTDQRPKLPGEINQVIAKALAKEPDARYASCRELMVAAEEALSAETRGPAPEMDTAEPAAVAGILRLAVIAGPASGTSIEVTDELLIGRHADGEGRLGNDPEISRNHARLTRTPAGGWKIEDLGSTNGTSVNGERVITERELAPRDSIEVGTSTLVVEGAAEPAAERPREAGSKERLSLQLDVDTGTGELNIRIDDQPEPVKLVREGNGWRVVT